MNYFCKQIYLYVFICLQGLSVNTQHVNEQLSLHINLHHLLKYFHENIKNAKMTEVVEEAKALLIRKKILGEKHPDYAESLSNMARMYRWKGDNKQAMLLIIKALGIRKKASGEEDDCYAKSLFFRALLHTEMLDYEKAMSIC